MFMLNEFVINTFCNVFRYFYFIDLRYRFVQYSSIAKENVSVFERETVFRVCDIYPRFYFREMIRKVCTSFIHISMSISLKIKQRIAVINNLTERANVKSNYDSSSKEIETKICHLDTRFIKFYDIFGF